MKKEILTLAMTFLCSYSIAQNASTPKVKFGLKAGLNFSKLAFTGNEIEDDRKDDAKNITFWQFGAYADVPLSTSFSLQPGIVLNGKGGERQLSELNTQLGPPMATGTIKSIIDVYRGAHKCSL